MRFAERDGERIYPNPFRKNATCPLCKSDVIAKCGKIKVWHWSHKNNEDCDNWGGVETKWHFDWKDNFPIENQEVIIGNHRADIKIKDIVIEFQNSNISLDNIKEREEFYGKMKWVLNGETLAKNFEFFNKKTFFSFKWKWFPKSWAVSKRYIFIDLVFMKYNLIYEIEKYKNGKKYCSKQYLMNLEDKLDILISKEIFVIKKIYNNGTGWGKLISKDDFIQEVKDGYY